MNSEAYIALTMGNLCLRLNLELGSAQVSPKIRCLSKRMCSVAASPNGQQWLHDLVKFLTKEQNTVLRFHNINLSQRDKLRAWF